MTEHFPIPSPPPELVKQWLVEHYGAVCVAPGKATSHVATQAAQWGLDQELEACCEAIERIWAMDHVTTVYDLLRELRAARRPKPPSLKEQALDDFDGLVCELDEAGQYSSWSERIRQALEQLPN